ncbi:hypothetical protein ACTHR6_26530 [Ralstonia holmesii]|uniref:hypothetical protein n=1 Tax=Ralstonia TaxID=48736 RepID=UPI00046ACDB1|nr:hypothetical protein [Ralstonia pickettii]
MSSLTTTLCAAASIEVGPVQFRRHEIVIGAPYVYATQRLSVRLHDGNHIELCFHLEEGAASLAAGETVAFPAVDEVPA